MKNFNGIVLLTLFILLIPLPVIAFSSYSTETQKFDTSLTDQSTTVYTTPQKIYVTQISTRSKEISRNPSLWVKNLYYYYITRLYLPDLPYTYLLDENGAIYDGKTGGVGANLQFNDLDNAIVIGYLSNSSTFTPRAETSLKELVESLSSSWGIDTVKGVQLRIVQEENKFSSISIVDAKTEFVNALNTALNDVKLSKEENHQYKVKIDSVEFPKESVIGSRTKVKVKATNINDFAWFTDKDPIYISTKSGEESKFAINKVWSSFSKPLEISDKIIKPNESIELEFEMEAKVLMGEVSESFVLQKFDKKPFEGSEFEVKFNVVKGDNTLVQVSSPQFGFVNIRTCRWSSCEIIDSPKDGTVFILLGEEEGWYKIQYAPGVEGWAMLRYFKKI
ncbi:MAG TPA: hypothetical protein PLG10_01690 [Candidatus Dojkabacteria bacterium]|jgi:hypothetical protein|nr:hypothetical protein [Candidatus Dojkabacteria bacterium]